MAKFFFKYRNIHKDTEVRERFEGLGGSIQVYGLNFPGHRNGGAGRTGVPQRLRVRDLILQEKSSEP